MSQIYQLDEIAPIVFHYNKAHNQDQTIAPWVLKVKGNTFYINHLDVAKNIGFSTRETPDNPSTKAALKFKGRLSIDSDGNAIIF